METPSKTFNRWWITAAGTVLQLCLGTVYAWSYFQKPLVDAYGWSHTQVAWVFSLAICCLGLAAAWGGMNLEKIGPRRLAIAGGLLFGGGYLIAALALQIKSLMLLYIGYGLCGGVGLGLGYVTPVATAAKWFPDKKGLVTGMVIMGFGLGALLMSKVLMPTLMASTGGNLPAVFACLGAGLGIVTVACGWVLRNPPAGALSSDLRKNESVISGPSVQNCLLSWRFAIIWGVFFCNIVAGISIIGFQSPLLQDLLKRSDPSLTELALAAAGSTLIAVSSLFNGIGRFFWGGVSDRLGRVRTFRIILVTQIVAFLILANVTQPWIFAMLVCYVLLCYGGGFGTMPALVLDVFGSRLMPVIYGTVLTAWSAGGIAGPQMVAMMKDRYGEDASRCSFLLGADLLALGFILSLILSDGRFGRSSSAGNGR